MTAPLNKTIKVEESVGNILMHDITEVIPGVTKRVLFKKGHIIKEEDISRLKDLGKENIYAFDIPDDFYHEDEAAGYFKQFAGDNVGFEGPYEGKVSYFSEIYGMLTVDKEKLLKINAIEGIAVATVQNAVVMEKGQKFAGARIIPLFIEKAKVHKTVEICSGSLFSIKKFSEKKVGLIVTGREVSEGRIKDGFRPVIESKISKYSGSICFFSTPGDDIDLIISSISEAFDSGCDLLMLTGGMSVDPDDNTKLAISAAGIDVVSYGVPVLPGNMFMVAYKGDIPVFGIPACALFYEITVLDKYLPYAFSDTRISKEDLLSSAYGGYCRHCEICRYPVCGFGKC